MIAKKQDGPNQIIVAPPPPPPLRRFPCKLMSEMIANFGTPDRFNSPPPPPSPKLNKSYFSYFGYPSPPISVTFPLPPVYLGD